MAHTGGGHLSAARSLAEALDSRAHITIISLVDDYVDFPWNTMSVAYGPWVNYAPWLYHLFYRTFDTRHRVQVTTRAAYPLVRRQIAAAFAPDWPDIVISVHPLQTVIPLRVLRELGNPAPFITVVTDPVTPPLYWFCAEMDLTVVATEPARDSAIACGVSPERVRVLGLPVRKAFSAIWGRSKPAARAQLGLDPNRPLVLLTGGGAGIGKLVPLARAIAKRLAKDAYPAQMAVIAGRNQVMKKQLQSERWPIPVKVLGFVDDMPNWLAAADLLVSKAGPGTLAEAACAGLPVIVTGHIPGQEDGNVTWIEQHGAGIYAREPLRVGASPLRCLRADRTSRARPLQRAQPQCNAHARTASTEEETNA
jgi:1,2-diacylglycerol 3-beta-galactosyltransferase